MQIDLFKQATVWTLPGCRGCEKVKKLLIDNGYELDIKDVTNREYIKELRAFTMASTVPQVAINGRFIGSIRQVEEYLNRK